MRKETVNAAFFFLVLTLLVFLAFLIVAPILDYMVFGFLLAIGFWPFHRRVRRWVRSDGGAAAVTLLVVALVVLGPTAMVAVSLLQDVRHFTENADPDNLPESIASGLGLRGERAEHLVSYAIEYFVGLAMDLRDDLGEILAEMLIGMMVIAFVMFYAFAQGPQMVDGIRRLLPLKAIYTEKLVQETSSAVHAIFFGTLFISVIHGVVLGIGFWIFGLPNPVLWGFVTIIVSILPAIGTPAIWAPAGAYLYLVSGPVAGIGMMVYGAVLSTGIIEHWFKLKLVGRMAGIHPLAVLVGVIGGIGIFGLSGFIFGPLILALMFVFLHVFSKTYQEDENYLFL